MNTQSPTDYETAISHYNATDDASTLGHCLPILLQQTAEKHSGKTALICADTELTYEELNTLANQFAHVLVARGVGRGDLVGIALARSIDLVVVLLAVLKAGAAYMPIDPAFPTDRIGHMVDDAKPKLIIAGASTHSASLAWGCESLNYDSVREDMVDSPEQKEDLEVDMQPDDLAYVIYTSGSTGKPKGVEISHGALCNLLYGMQREPGCEESDRLLAITTISFDIAALELFLPLLCGATVVVAPTHEAKHPESLLKLIERHNITIMQATPPTWQMMLDAGWQGEPHLSKILCGGDALPRRLAERLLPCADSVWNMYGPTEATVWASVWRVRQDEDVIIGKPIINYRLYVLDDNRQPVPAGQDGELYIGGASLARGYRNKPEMTQSRFFDNPFHDGLLYRTGDIAKFDPPEKMLVLGRADGQVKIRGYRIELGDIEAAITDHSIISDAVVISRDDRLIAYCIRDPNAQVPEEKPQPTLDSLLRPWLTKRLPAYMMPAFFHELKAFPMTLNNKIDRKALPDPRETVQPVASRPVTEIERSIRLVWSRILGHDRMSVNDNFFEIGGDSVRVVQVQKELEKLIGRPLSSARLFEHYTIKTLAAYLEGVDEENPKPFLPQRHVRDSNEDIAVVSMACRLPGGVSTPEEYWQLLERGTDVTNEVPKDRWDANALYDADPDARGKSYCRRGGFLSSVDDFDASFFSISPREARAIDPAQRIMLETCWEGFERAGYTIEQLRGSQTGVYIGVCNISAHSTAPALENLDGYDVTGSAGGTMSGRVSYALGLEGPTLTIDTACSSSLVTTHLACNALRHGECDMAVSGGVTLLLNPGMHIEFSRLRGMSADGRCRAFAEDTQGTGWAEGSTVVVLKRLSDAVRDGDNVHAILRGAAVNHAGRSAAGLTVPSGPAQQRLVRTALAVSGLTPGDIDYVEAHGTGTKLGDPIEGAALAGVFGGSRPADLGPLWIGSAKSNLGHTQAAAGLAGMLKVILATKHNKIPQTLHAEKPMLAVDWQGANMALVQKPQPWLPRADRPRRAGISAFGIGGTNAHVIVEEAPMKKVLSKPLPVPLPQEFPFLLSGHSDAAIRQQAEKLRQHIKSCTSEVDDENRLGEVAYSLATTRNHFRRRLVLMAKDKTALLEKLDSVTKTFPGGTNSMREPCTAMLFTGQGSQVSGMGKDLFEVYPVFRNAMNEIAAHFTELEMPLVDIIQAVPGSEAARLLHRTDFAQPALFTLEVALWHLWKSWGVQPDLVLGHSVGELSAAHVAGIFNLSDACRLVAARGRLMQAIPTRGKMVSLEASADEVTKEIAALGLVGKVDIAGHNTPTQTVASGDVDAIGNLVECFAGLARKMKMLKVSHAFHSHHMDGMLAEFKAVAETVHFNPPSLPMVSSLSGKLAEAGQLERPEYWVSQARRAVRFVDGIQTLHQQGANIFLELGPQPVLAGMGAASLTIDEPIAWLPSLAPKKHDTSAIQRSLAELHMRRVPISWKGYFEPFGCCERVELPTYAFQRERFPPLRHSVSSVKQEQNLPQDQQRQVANVDKFAFEMSWHEADTNNVILGGSWGLLCPIGNAAVQTWAHEVKKTLEQAGIRVHVVERLEDASSLDGILCLWDSASGEGSVVEQARDMTATALVQLQTAVYTQFEPWLVWATQHAVGAGAEDDRVVGVGAGPLWGLMRTARNEHPELRLRMIDLGLDGIVGVDMGKEKNTVVVSHVLPTALLLSDEPECAVRHNQLLVPRMQRLDPETVAASKGAKQRIVRTDGAVLITGGLGDLGQHVARWLVRVHDIRDLVLTSRRGRKAPGADKLIAELAEVGAKVTVVACEMDDPESIKATMSMFNQDRPLRGVIHAAGAQDNGVLMSLTPQRCATVYAPKVEGAWNLHQQTEDMDLDLFVMFSSISGVMGMAGHANYAAANTFLDALAHLRHAKGLPATAVAFGTWEGDGMAARIIGPTRARLTQLGLDMLTPEQGLELLDTAVRGGRSLTIAAALDQERLQAYHQERGGIPPFLRSLLRHSGGGSRRALQSWDLRELLSEADPSQRPDVILGMVQGTVAKALGFMLPSDVDVNGPLQDVGIDSLTAVLIRNQLATLTGLHLSARLAFQHPNLRALSQFLLAELAVQDDVENESDYSLSSNTPNTTTASETPWLNMDAIKQGCLDPTFTFANAAEPLPPPTSVFVTGATGFVGAYIVHELLELGIATHCLVRAASADQATERLSATLANYGLWKSEYAPLLHVLVGDMGLPLCGLSEATFDSLADNVDAICHSGALVDWVRPLDDYVGPNIVSAHEVLRLASYGRGKAVHLISTMSTIPKYMGYEIKEEAQEYGYATSKYMAERMVAAAHWRGARASVYRLPFVTASSTTGHFRLDRGDFLHNFISGCVEMGCFPSLDADLSAVLPIDYLCKTIVAAMTRDLGRIGQNYDFANARAPSFNHFFKLMSDASSGQGIIPFLIWRERALDYAATNLTSPIARIATLLDDVTDEKGGAAMVKGSVLRDHVFGTDDFPVPMIDEQFAQKYVSQINASRSSVAIPVL